MHDRLSSFLAGTIGIVDAISDLEGLLCALEETPEDWRQGFQDKWGTLEVFYAIALEHGDPVLPDASVPELRQAADSMMAMVDREIGIATG
jgi:hypothetical protein